jgi:hypothetical protein
MKYDLGRNLILALLFTALPGHAPAKSYCVGEHGSIEPCQPGKNETISSQLKMHKEYSANTLYYSGGILHNQVLLNKTNPPPKPSGLTDFKANNDLALEIETLVDEDANSEDLYSKIGAKFKSMKKVQKKDIQKCLRYGSYTAKVDGIWGNQTFEAIIDLKNEIEIENESQRDSVISKIKGVFSNKETCYEFISDVFDLSS